MRTILGAERIHKYGGLFAGKNIGLITNFSGISGDWQKDTPALFREAGYRVACIFTPEHGLYGAGAGVAVRDAAPKGAMEIPVISLYGEKKKPSQDDLNGVDVLVFDIQDVGLRYYTYIYTMEYGMEAAAKKKIPFVVLDRPNPLGCEIGGPRMDASMHSFVGDFELPMRHGLTVGETARYFKKYRKMSLELEILQMENYYADMQYPETGLWWNLPSPSIPAYESAVCYYGGCLMEATNLSEGRGCARPFQMFGAPFLDMDDIFLDLQRMGPERDIVFRKRAFIPASGKYQGEVCFGLEFHPLNGNCDFLSQSLKFLKAVYTRYPDRLTVKKETDDAVHLEILYGGRAVTRIWRAYAACRICRRNGSFIGSRLRRK